VNPLKYIATFPAEDPNKAGQKKILIVDDEQFNIDAIKIILEYNVKLPNINRIVDKAMNGLEAIRKVVLSVEKTGSNCYDYILMDCNMPLMDGYTATQ